MPCNAAALVYQLQGPVFLIRPTESQEPECVPWTSGCRSYISRLHLRHCSKDTNPLQPALHLSCQHQPRNLTPPRQTRVLCSPPHSGPDSRRTPAPAPHADQTEAGCAHAGAARCDGLQSWRERHIRAGRMTTQTLARMPRGSRAGRHLHQCTVILASHIARSFCAAAKPLLPTWFEIGWTTAL
jgi:hypothetical protein